MPGSEPHMQENRDHTSDNDGQNDDLLAKSGVSPDQAAAGTKPVFIARDFAYYRDGDTTVSSEPQTLMIERPVDDAWVIPALATAESPGGPRQLRRELSFSSIRKLRESLHLPVYRQKGNRADPPYAIPKMWGGLSPEADRERMEQARRKIAEYCATDLFSTLGKNHGPTQVAMDAARADVYLQEQMEDARDAGYGPLTRTPPNTPPRR